MGLIDTPALSVVQRIFRLGGSSMTGITDLDDGRLSQVVNVIPEIVRRSLQEGNATGWHFGVLQNVHSAADDEFSDIDPYNAGASAVAPYPAAVPQGWDVWLLGAALRRRSGAGALTGGGLLIRPSDFSQGWGEDDAGAALVESTPFPVAFWDSIQTGAAGMLEEPGQTPQGLIFQPINIRIARGCTLQFFSTSGAAATFQVTTLMGLFPEGLGQDVRS